MKNFNILAIALLVLIYTACKDDGTSTIAKFDPPTANQLSIANSSNLTGMNIFKLIESNSDNNYLISPLSINIALSMAYNGANGKTKEEIKNVLNINSMQIGSFNEDYSKLIKLLINSDSKVKLSSANSIWNIPQLIVETDYSDILNKYFSAESFKRDFSSPNTLTELNNWVKDKTNGKIEKILNNIDKNSVLFLVNAIYFKADWEKKFDKAKTSKDEFTNYSGSNSQVDMMYMKDSSISCYSDEKVKAFDLKYGDGNYSMTIILPNENTSVNDYIQELTLDKYNTMLSNMKQKESEIWMPKFKVEYKIELQDILQALGMKLAFSESADFSKITNSMSIFISSIIHKTFMEIDEEGTTAAAVTLIDIKNSSSENYFNIKVNRPFIIILREKTSNSILFLGRINKL
jgi:serine protease inhibitor